MYRVALLGLAACSFTRGAAPFDASHDSEVVPHDIVLPDMPPDSSDPDLVAYYTGDIATATTIPDASGNGHVGTCTSCPAFTSAHVGQGFSFSAQRFDVAAVGPLLAPTAFTVAFWMRADANDSQYQCMINKGYGAGSANSWQICLTDNLQLYYGTSGNALFTVSGVPLGQFHHVAITWDGTTKQIWWDASPVATATDDLVFDDRPVTIGDDIDSPGSTSSDVPFHGVLDEIRIYDRALSKTELEVLAQ